jgi:hypothetical protein
VKGHRHRQARSGPPALRVGVELQQPSNRFPKRDPQRLGELAKGQDCDVVLGPFHAADVGPMDPGLKSQFLLRQAASFAGLAEVLAEPDEGWVFLLGHPLKVRPGSVDIDIV